MTSHHRIDPPDLPELREHVIPADPGPLELSGVRAGPTGAPLAPGAVRVTESVLHGVALAGPIPGLALRDTVLDDCDLSNVEGRQGTLRRVAIERGRLVGFALPGGTLEDVLVTESNLALASFGHATLRNVAFEGVNLREASFLGAVLEGVSFSDCALDGADFRDARATACSLSGCSLEGLAGFASLRGFRMPWPDIVAVAGELAAALGIAVDDDTDRR